jgi:cation transport regulator ChaB
MTIPNNLSARDIVLNLIPLLLKEISVPSEYHEQIAAIDEMLRDDSTGLIDSLTDFAVESATVNFKIESDNQNLSEILAEWLENINKSYSGRIPSGIKAVAAEYFKEIWKRSSFPVLKLGGWEKIKGIWLPTKMFFIDSSSIYAHDKNVKEQKLSLFSYDYYLSNKKDNSLKIGDDYILSRPYCKWYDKYSIPYLIKRGVYHNYLLIKALKEKQYKLLNQIVAGLWLLTKGDAQLEIQKDQTTSDEEIRQAVDDLKKLIKDNIDKKSDAPVRGRTWDEKLELLVPKIADMFDPKITQTAEQNILSGLGFIDIAEAVSASRRESILNPKAFVREVQSRVDDFKNHILKSIMYQVKEENKKNIKYMNAQFFYESDPVTIFLTDEFKNRIRQQYRMGNISKETAVQLTGDGNMDFNVEVMRRNREARNGLDIAMYPPVAENREGQGIDIPSEEYAPTKEEDKRGKPIPDDKVDTIEKKDKYDVGKTKPEKAIYRTIKELPKQVRNNMSPNLQTTFLRVFNNALERYKNETRAWRIAWSVIKRIGKKNKQGKWVRKASRIKANQKLINEIAKIIEYEKEK